MKSKTHKRAIRELFPWADPRAIDAASALIDNPPAWLAYIPQLGRLPGLRYTGHRTRGHDLLGAFLAAIMAGHPSGLAAVPLHLTMDLMRDWMVRRYGPSAADLAEDAFNMVFELTKDSKQSPAKRRPSRARSRNKFKSSRSRS